MGEPVRVYDLSEMRTVRDERRLHLIVILARWLLMFRRGEFNADTLARALVKHVDTSEDLGEP